MMGRAIVADESASRRAVFDSIGSLRNEGWVIDGLRWFPTASRCRVVTRSTGYSCAMVTVGRVMTL